MASNSIGSWATHLMPDRSCLTARVCTTLQRTNGSLAVYSAGELSRADGAEEPVATEICQDFIGVSVLEAWSNEP